MTYPLPGMNPYLEQSEQWPTVHNRLIVAIADFLTPLLIPKYQVDIDKRVYEVTGLNTLLVGRPDVTVQQSRQPVMRSDSSDTAVAVASAPIQVTLPTNEEVREAYLEVKDTATQKVVTAIEILSPINKRGEGRQKYLTKRQKILASRTNLVEIDLLLQRKSMPLAEADLKSQYRILVSRDHQRPKADLYAFGVRDRIPDIPLPLTPNDPEPVVELQMLLEDVYGRSGYEYFLDYQEDLNIFLEEEDRKWLKSKVI
ncbi:MAG: DUF4058 family protein [Spirulina sp. SIO3F2]|nr:DUF4058 family protein [Spirulina sp. SIO3F2]